MAEPLDVSLRVRLLYEAGGTAGKAIADLEQLRAKARQLGQGGGADRLTAELGKVAPAAGTAGRAVSNVSAAAARLGTGDGARRLAGELNSIGHASQPARRDIVELAGAAERLGQGRGAGRLVVDLGRVGREADETARKLERLAIGGRARDFGGGVMASGGFGGLARFAGLGVAGATGLAIGSGVAAIGAAFGQATRQAIDFETAMSEVAKATNATDAQLKDYRAGVLRVAQQTGVSREQIAGGMAQAGFAGIPNEDILRFSAFSAKTAGAFDMSASDAGDQLAKLRNVFGFNQDQLEDAANGINTLGDTTAAKERQILAFLSEAGSAAKLVGLKPLHAAAYGATMEATGMEAGQAATSFSAMLEILGSANKQPKHVQDALRALHLNGREVQRGMQDDPDATIQDLLKRINALPEKGPNSKLGVIRDLFGQEHAREVATLAGQVDNLRAALERMDDASLRAGSVEKTFQIFSETTRAKIDRMSEAIGAFGVRLGSQFSPAVGAAADAVASFFGRLNDGAEKAEKAAAFIEKIRAGTALTPEERAQIDADPAVKRQVDRVEEQKAREAILGGDKASGPAAAPSGRKPEMFGPRMPDAEDRAFNERWHANRARAAAEIAELQKTIKEREGRGFAVSADRLKLRDRVSRFQQSFGEDPAPAEPPVGASGNAPTLPGADKRADLADRARVSLAAYNGELEAGLDRAMRIVDRASREMNEKLAIRARFSFDGAAGREGGGLIEASYGGGSGQDGGGSFSAQSFGGGGGRFNGLGKGTGGRRHAALEPASPGGPTTRLGRTGAAFGGKAPAIMRGLMDRYGLTREQAAGILGNLGHESAGFTAYHEGGQASQRGGVGWAQWTGPRRRMFEAWTREHGLDPKSDEASWRYLTEGDPETPAAIAAVKRQSTVRGATRAWESSFERAGVKAWSSRDHYAERAYGIGPGEPASSRFAEPSRKVPRESADTAPTARSRRNAPAAAPPMTMVQNFHGTFDEIGVMRRATMEKNREVRRTMAAALHGIGRIG